MGNNNCTNLMVVFFFSLSAFIFIMSVKLHFDADMSFISRKQVIWVSDQVQHITKTCPCNIEIFKVAKFFENFLYFFFFFFFFFFFQYFLIFAQNIDCGYTSTHNLCFEAKIRKICLPLHTPVLLYKSGVQGGIHYLDMFS